MNCPTCKREMPDAPCLLVQAEEIPGGVVTAKVLNEKGEIVFEVTGFKSETSEKLATFANKQGVNLHFHWKSHDWRISPDWRQE